MYRKISAVLTVAMAVVLVMMVMVPLRWFFAVRSEQCPALGTVSVSKGDGSVGDSGGGSNGIQYDAGDCGDGSDDGNDVGGGGDFASAPDSSQWGLGSAWH